jgi:hypothetical protein
VNSGGRRVQTIGRQKKRETGHAGACKLCVAGFLFGATKKEILMIQQATRSTPRADLGEAFHEFSPAGMTFVAAEVLPERPVAKKAATLGVVTRENVTTETGAHANGAGFDRVNLTTEDKSYACYDFGLEGQLTDPDRENYASDFDAEVETIQLVKTKMLIAREVRAAAALFNTSTWTGAALTTDVSGDWDAAASDVIGHVRAAKEKVRKNTGVTPDSMLIGPVTFASLQANTAILAKFIGVPVLTDDLLKRTIAQILGIQNLFVADGVYNSAKENQTASMADIWSDDYALVFKRQAGSLAQPGLGRLLTWTGEEGNLANGLETVVQYREEQTESDIFRVRDFVDEFICDEYFGHLLQIDT